MTRKRFVKLLMSKGFDRNSANAQADMVNMIGYSYKDGYRFTDFSVNDALKAISEAMEKMFAAVQKTATAITAGFNAFGEAYRAKMAEE